MKKEQINVKCNLCGSTDFFVLFEEGKAQIQRIVKCKNCDLIYANPQKDNVSNVEKNHLKSDANNSDTDRDLRQFNPENHQYLKKQFLQLKDYARIIDYIDKETKGTLVEIGSYAGIFLNEAKKRGWGVIGIEPLESRHSMLRKSMG